MFKKQKKSTKQVEHIWSQDPAIDQGHADFDREKYVETGDEKYLPRRTGTEPCRFYVRPLSGDTREYIERVARTSTEDAFRWLYELCAVGVVGVQANYEDGSDVALGSYMVRDKDNRIQRLNSDGMAMLFQAGATEEQPAGSYALIFELGNRVRRETYGDPLS